MPTVDDDIRLSWFEAGSGIFDGVIDDPSCYPPLDDRDVQRAWLAGFAGAWAELTTFAPADPSEDPRQRPVLEVLAERLANRPELLRQLLAISGRDALEFAA